MTIKDIKDKELYINKAREAEKKYNIPENTLVGLLAQESGHFNKDVISGKKKSYAGAIGIGQFMPKTAQFYKIDPLNVDQAIDASAKYLASSFNTFKNWDDAILSYNAGVGRVKEYKAGKPIKIKEHSEYVGRVKNQINRYGAGKLTNPKENITPELTDFDFTTQTPTFALEDSNVEEEMPKEEDKNKEVAQAKEALKEEQFMSDMFKGKITPIQLAQEEAPQQAPQSNLLESFSNIESFVNTPLAQQGLTVPRKKMSLEELDAKMKQTRALLDKGKVQQSNLKERPKEVVRESTQTTFRNETGRQVNTNPNQQISTKHVNERRTESQIIADRKKAVEESIKAQDESIIGNPNWRQTLATQTQSTGDKFRIFPNEDSFIDNYLNPAVMVGDMAKNLGQAPLQAQQQDSYMPYITSIGTPLAAGAMAGIGANSTGQFVNNLANPLAGTGDLINNLGNKYLSNAYKLNPNAFKPNPEAYYRVIGEAGYKDAIENNIIRPKINSIHSINYPTFKKGVPLDNRYASSEIKGLIGDNSYIVESNGNKMVQNHWTAAAPDKDIFLPRRELKAENEGINFYKKDWLQGYKQVEVPKEELIDLYRIQQKGAETFAERAKNGNLHRFFNNPETLARKAEEEKYFGRWFTTDKNDLDWYLKDREFTNPEYIHTQVPKSKLSQYNIENFDKTLSRAPEREFILPQELIDRGKRYTDISQFQQGGQIPISSKGMYEFPNQKVVVPTNGSITMKNIPHKIKATSLETGETKILLPGLEYFFDKTQNVLEIPLKK